MPQHETPEPGPAGRVLLPALAQLPGHLLWRAHARVLLLVAEKLPAGVDIHAYATLLALADGQPRSQQSLAETTKVSRTTMAKVAASLADQGLLERVRNPADRRSYALTRTARGAGAVRRWERHVVALEEAFADGFTPTERDELRALLQAVVGPDVVDDAPDELTESIGFLVSRLHHRMHRDFLAALEPLGLEPRHVGSLTALGATGPVAQAELAHLLGVSGASVVQIVDDLERARLVERHRPAADRRTQVLHLTERAPDVVATALRAAGELVDERFAPLDAEQSARLVELLRRFVLAG